MLRNPLALAKGRLSGVEELPGGAARLTITPGADLPGAPVVVTVAPIRGAHLLDLAACFRDGLRVTVDDGCDSDEVRALRRDLTTVTAVRQELGAKVAELADANADLQRREGEWRATLAAVCHAVSNIAAGETADLAAVDRLAGTVTGDPLRQLESDRSGFVALGHEVQALRDEARAYGSALGALAAGRSPDLDGTPLSGCAVDALRRLDAALRTITETPDRRVLAEGLARPSGEVAYDRDGALWRLCAGDLRNAVQEFSGRRVRIVVEVLPGAPAPVAEGTG